MRFGPVSIIFGPSKVERMRREVAAVASRRHLARLTLPSGVSFVGRPSVDGDTAVLYHATEARVAHVVDLAAVAAVTDIAAARPAPRQSDLDETVDVGRALAEDPD